MITSKQIRAAFDDYLISSGVPEENRFWAALNVDLFDRFQTHVFEEYGIKVNLNKELAFYAETIEDDQAAIMFKLRYG